VQAPRASYNASRSSAERLLYAAHGNAQRWRQPEKKTAQEGCANGKNKYPPVQIDFVCAWQAAWPKRNKRMNADECEYYAEHASAKA